jgi:deoxyribose-phosphate aldolase
MIDHTLLKADARRGQLEALCAQAAEYGFKSVAINGAVASLCAKLLAGKKPVVTSVVGFPLGTQTIASKVFESEDAIQNGASEIDYVLNIGALKDGDLALIREEMERIVAACRKGGAVCKVILETCYLTDEEKAAACRVARDVRPDFVKTSTGFGTGGATAADVRLMKREAGEGILVKASGGIRSLASAREMVDAGASRLGTSGGPSIVEELKKELAA